MGEWIDFDLKESEFEDRDGNVLGAGRLFIELAGDGGRFEIQSVRYILWDVTGKSPERYAPVPTHIADFIADWFLTPKGQATVRKAYEAELSDREDYRSADRAEWGQQYLSAAE